MIGVSLQIFYSTPEYEPNESHGSEGNDCLCDFFHRFGLFYINWFPLKGSNLDLKVQNLPSCQLDEGGMVAPVGLEPTSPLKRPHQSIST